ncbi:MAG TPA: hypothetical protein VFG20_08085 [Planctomycetaceae bacterium]|nr:hypothetical protein [Planctomycetaceae bacterium]
MPTQTRIQNLFTRGLVFAMTCGGSVTGWTAAESLCPAPRATCVLPAARLAEPPPGYFHHGGFEAALTTADANCADPVATCIQPPARLVDISFTGRLSLSFSSSIPELLGGWSAASQRQTPLTPTEKQWLARRHEPWLSPVALETIVRLTSSVDADTLAQDFEWTLDARRDAVVLTGVPTDDTQRLFCPQLRVELDPVTQKVSTIDLADRAGIWRPIDLPWAVLLEPGRDTGAIVLTADAIEVDVATTDLPPSPSGPSVIRLAAEAIELSGPARR